MSSNNLLYHEKFDNSVKLLELFKPRTILLTGKSSTGKTFLSNKMSNIYSVLDLDILVRELGKKYKVGDAPDYGLAFHIYSNKVDNMKFKKEFISRIRKFISKNKYSLICGALSDKDLINEVFLNIDYTFVYVNATSFSRHYKRMYERVLVDIENKKQTLFFWSYMKEGDNMKKKLKEYVKKCVDDSKKRLEYLINSGFDMFIIDV